MNTVLWLLLLVAFAYLSYHVTFAGRSLHKGLPKDFDFDLYKTRELNLRGLFDKTKWK